MNNINGYALDKYQSRVVLSEEEATLVKAGAGSGKSLTIIGRVVYLIKRKNVNPKEILIISFTNDATNNLKSNLKKNNVGDVVVTTFHKLALNIIKEQQKDITIAPEKFLEETIDTFFLLHKEKYQKEIDYIMNKEEQNLNSIKKLILTFIHLFKANNYDLFYFKKILKKMNYSFKRKEVKKNKYLLLLIINIYLLYEEKLKTENALDFDDMVNYAIKIIKRKNPHFIWKYIIIDEYQDTSFTRFQLIEKIRDKTQAKILVVGDDFQSIYRFTGCNLYIFLNFTSYFKNACVLEIVNTYRNPQELIEVAGSFIMKNKLQQKKNLFSKKHLKKPIKIIYTKKEKGTFFSLLKYLKSLSLDILVLGRNNKDIYDYFDKPFVEEENHYFVYNQIRFRYLTIHKAKGLESDNVIIINMKDKINGIPTKLKNEKILKYVNKEKDVYPFEEERRLFYVALTRTKNYCFIISPYKESIFTKEISKYKKQVEIKKE